MEEETVEVKFITHLQDNLKVSETPIRVPAKLGRFGLSGLINHLLSLDPPKPFDFLISEEFLRASISEYLQQHHLTSEVIIIIEYTEANVSPNFVADCKHNDWVSSLSTCNSSYFVTGSYDNLARVWMMNGRLHPTEVATCTGHTDAINAVSMTNRNNSISFVTASQDTTLRLWQGSQNGYHNIAIGKGHSASVQSVAILQSSSEDTLSFCSGGWDKEILVWRYDQQVQQSEESVSEHRKKRKLSSTKEKISEMAPIKRLLGHSQCVSCAFWLDKNSVMSSSWDHSIKLWDVENGKDLTSMSSETVVLSISLSPKSNLVVSGHSDKTVRLWDYRHRAGMSVVFKSMDSHSGWVPTVAWHPQNEYSFLSGSYDKLVKLWDTRSSIPLQTLSKHQDRVLCVGWSSQADSSLILSGGVDCNLFVWKE